MSVTVGAAVLAPVMFTTTVPPPTVSGLPWIGVLPTVLRLEALLSADVPVVDFAERASTLAGDPKNGLERHETLRAAIAFEFGFPQNTTVIFQPSLFYTFGHEDSLGPAFGGAVGDEWALIPVLFIERPFRFTRDRLSTSLTVSPYLTGPNRDFQGIKNKLIASYEFSQFIIGRLIYTDYAGGGRTDLYGQYRQWDNVGIEIQYDF